MPGFGNIGKPKVHSCFVTVLSIPDLHFKAMVGRRLKEQNRSCEAVITPGGNIYKDSADVFNALKESRF